MNLLTVANDVAVISQETAAQIVELERQAKLIDETQKALKKAIQEEMEANNILSIENDLLKITYVAPTDRETLDVKALKAELPDIHDAYVKLSPVKASIRIKTKQ